MRTIAIASGFFDPIHVGHIEYLQAARALADELIVILNSDNAAMLKKGYVFMPFTERYEILQSIRYVDKVVAAVDFGLSVNNTIELLNAHYKDNETRIIFAKGGDRTKDKISEKDTCERLGIEIVDGLGKKVRSSSKLVKKLIKNNITEVADHVVI
jgi:cytidyltransferase-like protein